ncbi:DEAD/DEAH box helicase family protein [Ectobacillus antri]|jgi:flagellar biosynthesis protein FlhF|uniref:Flagellar biosynthesis protein FlhF n=1 Tax=Ectobacillus antri TaxID=2486280 RepID=A0ABT6H0Y9_9BACI|nr:AAA family ATPase [Ectobacillus antri]MDG4656218.1 DEAD/DEAH box helicase family protein [Ectobacillus antri]MDG5752893.1 DEAD/DEAH box helicase family protein [Ectobacillus antri]
MMEQNLERIQIIRASNKVELYEKLFEQSGGDYYYVIEENIKRHRILPWRKEYEMIVKFVAPEPKLEPATLVPRVKSEEERKKEKLAFIMKALERRDESLPQTNIPQETLPPQKKKQFLEMLEEGHSAIQQETVSGQSISKEHAEIVALKQTIEELNKKLSLANEKENSFLVDKLAYTLKENDVEERVVNSLIEEIKQLEQSDKTEADIHGHVIEKLAAYFQTAELADISAYGMIALVGPTGVGKTTTLAKLAWQLRKKQRTVAFVTTDLFRSGAVSQLQDYADAMGFEMKTADSPEALRKVCAYFKEKNVQHILIDTVGRSYMDRGAMGTVLDYIQGVEPDFTCLTVSASMKSRDVMDLLAKFKHTNVNGLIVTKFDETASIGEWMTVSSRSAIPIAFVTDGQDVTKHICAPTKQQLAERVLSRNVEFQGQLFLT